MNKKVKLKKSEDLLQITVDFTNTLIVSALWTTHHCITASDNMLSLSDLESVHQFMGFPTLMPLQSVI